MGTGAARQYIAGPCNLLHAAERLRVVGDQAENLVQQVVETDHAALAEVDQALVEAVAHRAPAIFTNQHGRIQAPALVGHPQPVKHAQNTDEQGRQGYRVVQPRAHVHDPGLERRITGAGPQVPPDTRGVFDETGVHEDIDVALVLRVARESFRKTGARQRIEDREPVTLETRIAAFPERRGTGQGQQVRQEVRHLVHQVDAQFVVVDADVDVHAADEQAPRCSLHLDGQCVVAVLLRLLLFGPAAERVRRGGDRRHAVVRSHVDDDAAQPPQFDFRFLDVVTDLGADLDLRAQELGRHLRAATLFALGHETFRRVDHQAARLLVDEQVLFLYPYRERRTAVTHRLSPSCSPGVRPILPGPAIRFAPVSGRIPGAAPPRPRRRRGRCR